MIRYPARNSNSPDPLPRDFAPELHELDAKLADAARQLATPAGLNERVFTMSAAMLPVREAQSSPLRLADASRLRLKKSPAMPLHQTTWARLAMAACLVFACTVAIMSLDRKGSEVGTSVRKPAVVDDSIALAFESSHSSAAAEYESNLGYLRETMDMPYDDLHSDLAMLVSRF
jgi:hypothetical protein